MHIYIYIHIYIYNSHTRPSSFPGLISVARVNMKDEMYIYIYIYIYVTQLPMQPSLFEDDRIVPANVAIFLNDMWVKSHSRGNGYMG